jgi:hypothetical protein
MTKNETIQLALEALEMLKAEFRALDLPYGSKAYTKAFDVSHVLREALTQPERYLTLTKDANGELVMVSWQDEDHQLLEVLWEKKHG